MKFLIMILLTGFLYSGNSFAEVNIKIDTSSMAQEQKNMLISAGYRIAFENGENEVPTLNIDILSFTNLTNPTKAKITKQSLLDEIDEILAENEAAATQETNAKNTKINGIKTKLKGWGLTDAEIDFLFNDVFDR